MKIPQTFLGSKIRVTCNIAENFQTLRQQPMPSVSPFGIGPLCPQQHFFAPLDFPYKGSVVKFPVGGGQNQGVKVTVFILGASAKEP